MGLAYFEQVSSAFNISSVQEFQVFQSLLSSSTYSIVRVFRPIQEFLPNQEISDFITSKTQEFDNSNPTHSLNTVFDSI